MKTAETPRKMPRQARSQATVEAILEAAARILAGDGYAAMSTNRVAEVAGVSVGSLYQYFPNKDSLVAALHERHGRQMHELIISEVVAARGKSLRVAVTALVGALLKAHLIEPALHRVLEAEFPFFDLQSDDTESDQRLHHEVHELLTEHRAMLVVDDQALAVYIMMTTVESLVHAAVLDPPAGIKTQRLESAIVDLVMRYLSGSSGEKMARRKRRAAAA
jgi:AcrR family transcriptional regulator